jgi:hypothetical protein
LISIVQVSHTSPISQEKDLKYLLKKLNKLSRRRREAFNKYFDLCMRYNEVFPKQEWIAKQVGWNWRESANRALKRLRELGLLEVQPRGFWSNQPPYKSKTNLVYLPEWFTPELCAQYKAYLRSLKDQYSCKFIETRRKFVEITNSITSTLKQKVTHIKSSLFSKLFLSKNILPTPDVSTKSYTEETCEVTCSKKEDMIAVKNIPNSNNEFTKYIPKEVGWGEEFKDEIKLEQKDEEAFCRFKKAIEEADANKKALLKEFISIDLLPEEDKPTILANWRERNSVEVARWLSQSNELMKEDKQLFEMLYRR